MKMYLLIGFFLFFCLLLIARRAPLTEHFDAPLNSVASTQMPTLTFIYTYWCPKANSFLPEWETLTKHYSGTNLHLVAIDADQSPEVLSDLKITEIPTILFSINGVTYPFAGERTAKAVARFVELTS